MNSKHKNKSIATSLAVATAISTATTLPVTLVQQVKAKDDSNIATYSNKANEPTNKTELGNQLEKANNTMESTATSLEDAKLDRTDAIIAKNDAETEKNNNDSIIEESQTEISDTVYDEIILRQNILSEEEAELEALNFEKQNLEEIIQYYTEQLKTENSSLYNALQKLENDKDKYNEAKKICAELNVKRNQLIADKFPLEMKREDTKGFIASTISSQKETQEYLKERKEELEVSTKRKEELQPQYDAELARYDEVSKLLHDNYSETDIEYAEYNLNTLRDELKTLKENLEYSSKMLDEALRERTEDEEKLKELTSQVSSAQIDVDNLKVNVDIAKTAYENAKDECQKWESRLNYDDSAEENLAIAQANLEKASKEYENAKETLKSKEDDLDYLNNQKSYIETGLVYRNEAVNRETAAKAEDEKAVKEKEVEIENAQTKLNELKNTRENLLKEYPTLETNVKTWGDELADLNYKIEFDEEMIPGLEEALIRDEKQIQDYKDEIDELTIQIEDMDKQIAEIEAQDSIYSQIIVDYEFLQDQIDYMGSQVDVYQEYIVKNKEDLEQKEIDIENQKKIIEKAKENCNKAYEAAKQWEEIQNRKYGMTTYILMARAGVPFGPFDDEVLDNLVPVVKTYIEAKERVEELTIAYNNAVDAYNEADAKYQDALIDYENALQEYETAKEEYDAFVAKYGNVSEETITVVDKVLYSGTALTPAIIVKDSLGNIVESNEYTVIYTNNTEIGIASIIVTMNGENYVGTFTKHFKIVKDLNEVDNDNKDNQKPTTPDKKDENTTADSNKKDNTAPSESSTTKKSNINNNITKSNTVTKTGDETPIVGFGLMAMLSSVLFLFSKSRKEEQE